MDEKTKNQILGEINEEYFHNRYETLKELSQKQNHRTTLVWDSEINRVCVSKEIAKEQEELYRSFLGKHIPYLPEVYEVLEGSQNLIMVREYVAGMPIDKYLAKNGPFTVEQAIAVTIQILEGLLFIHKNGFVHRDIHPGNVLVDASLRVHVIDLGITRKVKEGQTKDTQVLGTVGYAAPEQFGFSQTDERTDIYSVGMLLNAMLTADVDNQVKHQGLLQKIIEKCIQMNPKDRYKNVEALIRDLRKASVRNRSGVFSKEKIVIPGFRTGKVWKMPVAVFFYLFLIIMPFAFLWDAALKNGFMGFLIDIVGVFFLFLLPFVLLTNFLRWTKWFYPFYKLNSDVVMAIRIVVSIASFLAGISVDSYARTPWII